MKNKTADKMSKLKKLLEAAGKKTIFDVLKSHGYSQMPRGVDIVVIRKKHYTIVTWEAEETMMSPAYIDIISTMVIDKPTTYHFELRNDDGGVSTYESQDMSRDQVPEALDAKLKQLNPPPRASLHQEPTA